MKDLLNETADMLKEGMNPIGYKARIRGRAPSGDGFDGIMITKIELFGNMLQFEVSFFLSDYEVAFDTVSLKQLNKWFV